MPPAITGNQAAPLPQTGTAGKGYAATFVAFGLAFLAALGITAAAILVLVLLLKTQSEGEAQFWYGLLGESLIVLAFLCMWPIFTYRLVKSRLAKRGYPEETKTALLCAALLPLGSLLLPLPFIPFIARRLALSGAGIKNKHVTSVFVVIIVILSVVISEVIGHRLQDATYSSNQQKLKSYEQQEESRVLGSQFQLTQTSYIGNYPAQHDSFTFAGSGTYQSLITALTSDFTRSGYRLGKSYTGSLVNCQKAASKPWACTFSGNTDKFDVSVTMTFPPEAIPAPGASLYNPTGASDASALAANTPVQSFNVVFQYHTGLLKY